MKVKFLGTAAAEGVPAVFCNCDTCNKARAYKGKDFRTRSQILIDDDMLIDFPMDTYMHTLMHDIKLCNISDIFITHAHIDHFFPQEFAMHCEPYAFNMLRPIINIFANETVINRFYSMNIGVKGSNFAFDDKALGLNCNTIKPFDSVVLKDKTVTALPAVHTKDENCFIYLVEKNGKRYLQYNDSGILNENVYKWLKDNNKKLDLVSFDCTYGYFRKGAGRHMGVLDNVDERERMKKYGLVNEQTRYILTHFSHNSNLSHNELNEIVEPLGFLVAFDGMKIEL